MPKSSKPRKNHTPRPINPSVGATPQQENPYRTRIVWQQPEGPGTRIGGVVARLDGDTPELFGRMLADITRLVARSFAMTEAELPSMQRRILDAIQNEIQNPTCDERGARSA